MSASDAPTVPARHVEGHLEGGIYWQGWLPEGGVRAVVVVVHGAMEHSGRYRYVVERLVPEGYAVYAVDHRGHGRSPGRRGNIGSMRSVVADVDRLVDQARREHPGRKLFLLGHSLGGTIAIAYAIVHQEKLDGLALSAPLARLDAPLVQRLAVKAVSTVAPNAGLLAIGADGVSRDSGEVAAYEADPLNGHGKMPARLLDEMLGTTARFEAEGSDLTLPLLVMIGTADRLVSVSGAQMVHDRAQSTDKTLHLYDGFFHEIFNEPAGDRDRPLDDLAAWLSERTKT